MTINVQGPFATNNSESLRDAVLAGLGVALLPDFSAREAIGRGLVQELLPARQPVEVFADRLYVIRPYTPRVSRAVENLQPLPESDLQRAASSSCASVSLKRGSRWRSPGSSCARVTVLSAQ